MKLNNILLVPTDFSDVCHNAIDYAVSNGLRTQEEAAAYFNLKNYIIEGMIGTPIMGVVTSLVVAIFTRKK